MRGFKELFDYVYKGDVSAIELSIMILDIVHLWDDVIDKDKEYTDEEVDRAFMFAMVDLHLHPLWTPEMSVLFKRVYYCWNDANKIEKNKESTDNDLAMAWMLRAGVYDLFVAIAEKLYGREWAKQISLTVHLFYGESLEDFIAEVRNA